MKRASGFLQWMFPAMLGFVALSAGQTSPSTGHTSPTT